MGARQKGDELKGEEEQRCLSFAFQYRFPSSHCDNDATIVVPPYTVYYLPVRSCSCQRGWRPCGSFVLQLLRVHPIFGSRSLFLSISKKSPRRSRRVLFRADSLGRGTHCHLGDDTSIVYHVHTITRENATRLWFLSCLH